VPAPFIRDLCGYRRDNGNPNTSDSNDKQSVTLGRELFKQLGVPLDVPEPPGSGAALEDAVVQHLRSVRSDLVIERSRSAKDFAQYAHLDVFPSFRRSYGGSRVSIQELIAAVGEIPKGYDRGRLEFLLSRLTDQIGTEMALIETLKREMPEESLLKIDISVALPRSDGPDELAVALSSKWSLRTDRAQDCVSQGSKLVAQRRGRMPHFGVITIEPRPAMLKILADGSGSIDYVYHLDLPALAATIETISQSTRRPDSWSPRLTFDRLVSQRRIRDFDELVWEVSRLPRSDGGASTPVPGAATSAPSNPSVGEQ
jgi:NgoMIV restriction enzyme